MVSQVKCVICAIVPEPHTTEITFYKFPKATELPIMFKAWKSAMVEALSNERPEFSDDSNFNETYVCSRHFIASDFSFDNGKLILLKDAIPSRVAKKLYDTDNKEDQEKIAKEYEPNSRTCNFASTSTKDYVTTSHHNLRSDLISTGTSWTLTPSISEFAVFQSTRKLSDGKFSDIAKVTGDSINAKKRDGDVKISDNITKDTSNLVSVKKRDGDLLQKIESFGKIFKRLRSDNLLTESYLDKLKEHMPEAEQLLNEVMKSE